MDVYGDDATTVLCMETKRKVDITKLNGNDFSVWKFQIRAYLQTQKLLEIVEGKQRRPADDESDKNCMKKQEMWDEYHAKPDLRYYMLLIPR
ncbi:hypothetical protein FQA39_LY06073 [Lamprigera yunnana]|nr:hypothetical protein FQA39_LY06073 [Lamprigera yunnana]